MWRDKRHRSEERQVTCFKRAVANNCFYSSGNRQSSNQFAIFQYHKECSVVSGGSSIEPISYNILVDQCTTGCHNQVIETSQDHIQ